MKRWKHEMMLNYIFLTSLFEIVILSYLFCMDFIHGLGASSS